MDSIQPARTERNAVHDKEFRLFATQFAVLFASFTIIISSKPFLHSINLTFSPVARSLAAIMKFPLFQHSLAETGASEQLVEVYKQIGRLEQKLESAGCLNAALLEENRQLKLKKEVSKGKKSMPEAATFASKGGKKDSSELDVIISMLEKMDKMLEKMDKMLEKMDKSRLSKFETSALKNLYKSFSRVIGAFVMTIVPEANREGTISMISDLARESSFVCLCGPMSTVSDVFLFFCSSSPPSSYGRSSLW